ncbi:hypothetical protein SCHPADRAFT_939636 [Schizopora paradoxa]|uniref:Uncharacterized protein n=1 Tax=Schizopora paradoxa TaxID=27342 RepID=A0A0H2RRW6_9AGAM|nr:hypothetical protein SCHPADRAFT_939636 [Schizopora paradoxa]
MSANDETKKNQSLDDREELERQSIRDIIDETIREAMNEYRIEEDAEYEAMRREIREIKEDTLRQTEVVQRLREKTRVATEMVVLETELLKAGCEMMESQTRLIENRIRQVERETRQMEEETEFFNEMNRILDRYSMDTSHEVDDVQEGVTQAGAENVSAIP